MKNFNKCSKALGFDKILDKLSNMLECEDSKHLVTEIEPVSDIFELERLLSQTNDANMLLLRFGAPSFNGLSNIDQPLNRAINGGLLSTVELLKISDVLYAFNCIKEWKKHSSQVKSGIDFLFDSLYSNKYLEEKIKSIILSEDTIADNASPELLSIRKKINSASDKIREKLDKLVHSRQSQKYLQDALVTIREGRFVIPVKAEHRKEIPGLIHDSSASGATIFVEPMEVVEANNEIRILRSQEKKEIERILLELSLEAGSFAENISSGYSIATKLNVLFAKAELAYKMNAVVPKINDKGQVNLRQARHPLIDKSKVVPTNITLGIDFKTLIITGPNTGGKTVSLKTIGLLTLMAMCGFMIPAGENSTISVFKNILVDIGDEQSIEQSLSTFSSHMTNIIDILNVADNSSLVLLDELGAGTDPTEGAALAMAIIEALHEKGAKIVATTHYSELKSYAISTNGIENACCEFDVKTLSPTYKLLIGVPGKSNAFAISSRLGMSANIINRAKDFISEDSTRFEEVISNLEGTRFSLEEERKELESLLQDAKKAKEKLALKEKELDSRYKQEVNLAKEKAISIVSTTRAQAESLISELEKLKKQKDIDENDLRKLKSGIKNMEDAADPIERRENKGYVLPRPIKVGDSVLIFDIDKKGIVIEANKGQKEVIVQAGIIKTKVPISNLRLLKESIAKKTVVGRVTKSVNSKAQAKIEREIDLRGKSSLEAIIDLDSFIDSAILAGVNQLTIIHGKGTGVLRKEINKHLKTHPAVKSHRLGVFGEGEDGVTIVELK